MKEDARKIALNKNIMILSGVILALFVGIMSYMVYFKLTMADEIATKPGNIRFAAQRNEVLRGTIYDRNGTVLSYTERQENGNQKRIYNGAKPFAQIMGYTETAGTTGLESYMDKTMITDEYVLNINRDNFLEILKNPTKAIQRTKVGNSVVTTLDTEFQQKAYELLGDTVGTSGSIVALNPKTGEILAMVNRPSYDPNALDEEYEGHLEYTRDDGVLLNKAARATYFPGSTFKIITLLAALENLEGVTERTFEDRGLLDVKTGKDLPNVNGNVYGDISLKKAFSVSSNVVFGGLAIEIGGDKLQETAERFGFNQDLGLRDMTVGKSIFTAFGNKDDGALAASGIGQTGVSTHPLQMAMIVAAVANGGKLMTPRIVSSIMKYDGTTKEVFEPELYSTPMSVETAQTIRDYMKNNVDSSNNANMKALSGIRASGKTGTAEDFFVTTGTTAEGDSQPVVNSWFVGFAPSEDPEIAIAVVVIDGGSGGGKAAEISANLMSWYLENR